MGFQLTYHNNMATLQQDKQYFSTYQINLKAYRAKNHLMLSPHPSMNFYHSHNYSTKPRIMSTSSSGMKAPGALYFLCVRAPTKGAHFLLFSQPLSLPDYSNPSTNSSNNAQQPRLPKVTPVTWTRSCHQPT
jgi:hypothetical protein